MRHTFSRLLAVALLALSAAPAAHAQDVSFGGPVAGTNVLPFTSYDFQPANRYQQLYVGSAFAQPVWIDAIRFANSSSVAQGQPGSIAPGNYLVRLAVTDRAQNALTTSFDANVTGFAATFFSGTIGSGLLRIAGSTPYLFDPSRGNLLLDVTVLSQEDVFFYGLDFSRSATDGTSRVFNTFPNPVTPSVTMADASGLNTTFETRAVVATPEPASLGLVASGLGLVVVSVRRRRRA